MNGKITMSRRGRTGSTSGILAGSSSFSFFSSIFLPRSSVSGGGSLFLFPGHGDDGLAAPPVLQTRKRDRQDASLQPGGGLRHVDRRVEKDRAREAAMGPLHAQEGGGGGSAALAPLAAHHQLPVAARDVQRVGGQAGHLDHDRERAPALEHVHARQPVAEAGAVGPVELDQAADELAQLLMEQGQVRMARARRLLHETHESSGTSRVQGKRGVKQTATAASGPRLLRASTELEPRQRAVAALRPHSRPAQLRLMTMRVRSSVALVPWENRSSSRRISASSAGASRLRPWRTSSARRASPNSSSSWFQVSVTPSENTTSTSPWSSRVVACSYAPSSNRPSTTPPVVRESSVPSARTTMGGLWPALT